MAWERLHHRLQRRQRLAGVADGIEAVDGALRSVEESRVAENRQEEFERHLERRQRLRWCRLDAELGEQHASAPAQAALELGSKLHELASLLDDLAARDER